MGTDDGGAAVTFYMATGQTFVSIGKTALRPSLGEAGIALEG